MIPVIPIDSAHGKVFLAAFDKVDHRQTIFALLSEACGCCVTSSDLVQTEDHPRPEFPSLPLDANWTHSGDVCVLAYSFECRVGIDLEQVKKRRLEVFRRFYAPEEVAALEGGPIGPYYDLWCRKEAFFKCIGGSFFEGSLGRSMLADSVDGVQLKKLDPKMLGIQQDFSLCLATAPKVSG